MQNLPYWRMVKGSSCAFLLIHGFLGTPDHFKPLLSLLPDTVSVCNLLLDGHGKDPRAFARARMRNWEVQVDSVVRRLLENHEKVYIVAHSMGTLLALEESRKYPGVAGLFLLAVPVKLRLKPKLLLRSMKVCFQRIDPENPWELAAENCYGIAPDSNPLHYVGWLPRLWELFRKIHSIKKQLSGITTPCTVLLSGQDELISPCSAAWFRENPAIRTKILLGSGHYYYPPGDLALLLSAFQEFLREAGI